MSASYKRNDVLRPRSPMDLGTGFPFPCTCPLGILAGDAREPSAENPQAKHVFCLFPDSKQTNEIRVTSAKLTASSAGLDQSPIANCLKHSSRKGVTISPLQVVLCDSIADKKVVHSISKKKLKGQEKSVELYCLTTMLSFVRMCLSKALWLLQRRV